MKEINKAIEDGTFNELYKAVIAKHKELYSEEESKRIYTDPYLVDKWYNNGKFDVKAAQVLGFEEPNPAPSLEIPDFGKLNWKEINAPIIDRSAIINNQYWNIPKLIELYEEVNPGTRFSRANITYLKKKLPTIKAVLAFENLKEGTPLITSYLTPKAAKDIFTKGIGDRVIQSHTLHEGVRLLLDQFLEDSPRRQEGGDYAYQFNGIFKASAMGKAIDPWHTAAYKISTRDFNIKYEDSTEDDEVLSSLHSGLSKRHFLSNGNYNHGQIIFDTYITYGIILNTRNELKNILQPFEEIKE